MLAEYKTNFPELEKFAYSSAYYCLAEDENTHHYGLNTETYTHATSPIRRYADLLNQRVIKKILESQRENKEVENYIIPLSMLDINSRQKDFKRFERDLIFLRAIQNNKTQFNGHIVDIIIINDEHNPYIKLKIYIKDWNKIITVKYKYLDENTVLSKDEKNKIYIKMYQEVSITVAFNMNARCWKDRAIIHLNNL
jgi:exoribonuclease R